MPPETEKFALPPPTVHVPPTSAAPSPPEAVRENVSLAHVLAGGGGGVDESSPVARASRMTGIGWFVR